MGTKIWDGAAEKDTAHTLWDGSAEKAATVAAMPTGYASVADMLAKPPFFVAHRGGSLNWPEMSLRGMTESVARGVGALEISLARTLDGVWFGMHDENFDRTAGKTGTPKASAVNWADVNKNYGNGSDRYYTLQELMGPWRTSHVFFIDPKYAGSRTSELFALIKTLVPASRVVIKYYGDNANLAAQAKAQGFQTWGYFYPADVDSGMFNTYKGSWDILGMSYDAAASYWNTLLAAGKPVIGHICPNASAVNIARTKGASGLMVSGIREAISQDGL